jgi:hypothetical protein
MTIAIAVRTGSAVVFAADSKLTTAGLVGINEDGTPRWQDQTYDSATKIAADKTGKLMAMVAGHANVGEVTATDFMSTHELPNYGTEERLRGLIIGLVAAMDDRKRAFWTALGVAEAEWPGPTILLAAPSPDGITPRVWRAELAGPGHVLTDILPEANIRLEGSYDEVYSLLYGRHPDFVVGIRQQLGVNDDQMRQAIENLPVLLPIDKLSLRHMPVQDAIDLAVFLCRVQVEMDRFLPGTPACGGPIDVMVLRMAPTPAIIAYPGKTIRHPYGEPR